MNPALMMLMRARGAAPSGVLPTDYGNLTGWWKADAITGVADAGSLATWPDSSGAEMSLGQGTSIYRPVYRQNQIGGLPAVDFDGTDDSMTSGAASQGNEQTVCAVVRLDALKLTMIRGASGGGGVDLPFVNADGTVSAGVAGQGASVTSTETLSTGVWYILTGTCSASNDFMRVRINGSQYSGTWTGTSTTARSTRVSNNSSNNDGRLDGQIAELISYQALRSDAEIEALEDYLATKYGL